MAESSPPSSPPPSTIVEALRLGAARRFHDGLALLQARSEELAQARPAASRACEALLEWSAEAFDGRYAGRLGDAIEGITRLQDEGFEAELGWAYSSAGFGMGLVGDLEGGLQWIEKAIVDATRRGEPEQLCRFLANKGALLALAMDHEGALEVFDQALASCDKGSVILRASILNNTAFSSLVLARQAEAGSPQRQRMAQAALQAAIDSRAGLDPQAHQRWWAWSMGNEGGALSLLGRHAEAEAVFEAGLPMARVNSRIELVMMTHRGRSLAETGRLDAAREWLERAHRLALDAAQTDLLDPTLDLIIDHLQFTEVMANRPAQALHWSAQRIRRLESQHRNRLLAVRRHVALFERLEAQRRAEGEQAQAQLRFWKDEAQRDPLTGALNRRGLQEALDPLLRSGAPLALALLDFDHFKQVNDRFGHPVGDQVLATSAQLLRSSIRGSDFLARLGGEEFCVVLEGCDQDRARQVCEQLRRRIETHDWTQLAPELLLTVSIGTAASPGGPDGPGLDRLIEQADRAMYAAKLAGRNRVH